MTEISLAGVPWSNNHATRAAMTRVFPLPGPATTNVDACGAVAARAWAKVKPCKASARWKSKTSWLMVFGYSGIRFG